MSRVKSSVVLALAAAVTFVWAAPAAAVDDLSLNVAPGSENVQPGDTVTVTLDVANLSASINGVQVLLNYDTTILTLVDVVPTDLVAAGLIVSPAEGWVETLQDEPVSGDLDWAAVINNGGIAVDHTIATLTFTVIEEGTTSIIFRPDEDPKFTKLTRESDSTTIFPNKLDSGTITSSCDDGNECTTDTVVGGLCDFTNVSAGVPCGDPTDTDCDNPDTCDGAGNCVANFETSGTACTDDGNECTDDVCDGSGTCTHPALVDGTVCTDDGNDCTDDVCSSGTCTHPDLAAGTACGDPSDTDCTNPDTCDGFGVCLTNDETSGTVCTDDGNECTDDVCDGTGTCTHPALADGTVCTDDGNDCTDDVCSGGTCTHPDLSAGTACGDPTDTDCDNPDTCDGFGVCLSNNETSGTLCTDDGNECTDDVCDGSGTCTHPALADGTACIDDGNDCTNDICSAGTCTHPALASGTACGDQTLTDCSDPDTCDGAGTCQSNDLSAGTACTDDGNDCTDDVCDGAGACTHPDLAAGTACGDPSDTDCTNPDTCDGAGVCLANDETSGTVCTDDGNECTNDVCDGTGTCTHPNASDGTACTDDGNDCTDDFCSAGTCTHPDLTAGTACGDQTTTDCSDPDTCDGAGVCLSNDLSAGTTCTDDGNDCTDDVCDGSGTCTHPNLSAGAVCTDDGNDCTDDVCDGAGTCTHPNLSAGTACGDQTTTDCTDPDTCDGAGVCLTNDLSSGISCTDDGNECTTDVCDGSGTCTHPPVADGTDCTDDGLDCSNDFCQSGTCTHPVKPSGITCRASTGECDVEETCDGTSKSCPSDTFVADGTACTDDGNACTADECLSGTCSHPDTTPSGECCDPADGTLTTIDDGDPCTLDSCDTATGTVSHDPGGDVNVSLKAEALNNAVTRDVKFAITTCAATVDQRTVPVSFDGVGIGSVTLPNVDANAAYIAVQEGHTLQRRVALSFDGTCQANVDLTGSKLLLAGDLQTGAVPQDNLVDITDFSILAARWNTSIDPTLSTGADVTGNGQQDSTDFAAMQVNYFVVGDVADACTLTSSGGDSLSGDVTPIGGEVESVDGDKSLSLKNSVLVQELPFRDAYKADLNVDGVIDETDIRLFARIHGLELLPEFERRLNQLSGSKAGRSRRSGR